MAIIKSHAAMAVGVREAVSAQRAGSHAQPSLHRLVRRHAASVGVGLRNSAMSGTEPHMQNDSLARGNWRGW